MKLRLLLFAAALLGAFPSPGYTPEEEALARELAADPGIRDRARGTPAEFMANQRGWMEDGARALLDGSASPERKARIVALYSRILRDIRRGLDWKEPRRQVEIPHLPQALRIDGAIAPGEWAGALLFEGEYPLDGTRKLPGTATRWRVGWHGEMFCVAAEFRDPEVTSYDYTGFEPGETPMYLGDALELFLRPTEDSPLYYEFLVNPSGKLWALAHVNDPRGSWIRIADRRATGARAAAERTPEGFRVELAVPLAELCGPGLRRSPGAGDTFTFMMVRTDRTSGVYRRAVPVPLLYEGHNIFGYIRARLGETGTPRQE